MARLGERIWRAYRALEHSRTHIAYDRPRCLFPENIAVHLVPSRQIVPTHLIILLLAAIMIGDIIYGSDAPGSSKFLAACILLIGVMAVPLSFLVSDLFSHNFADKTGQTRGQTWRQKRRMIAHHQSDFSVPLTAILIALAGMPLSVETSETTALIALIYLGALSISALSFGLLPGETFACSSALPPGQKEDIGRFFELACIPGTRFAGMDWPQCVVAFFLPIRILNRTQALFSETYNRQAAGALFVFDLIFKGRTAENTIQKTRIQCAKFCVQMAGFLVVFAGIILVQPTPMARTLMIIAWLASGAFFMSREISATQNQFAYRRRQAERLLPPAIAIGRNADYDLEAVRDEYVGGALKVIAISFGAGAAMLYALSSAVPDKDNKDPICVQVETTTHC